MLRRALFQARNASRVAFAHSRASRNVSKAAVATFAAAAAVGVGVGTVVLQAEAQAADRRPQREFVSKLRRIFEIFASQTVDGKPYMTLDDFLKSMIAEPDGHKDESFDTSDSHLRLLFNYASRDRTGLINFSEYVLLFKLLTTPESEFEIAFVLFDLDGKGTVTKDEFKRVISANKSGFLADFDFDCELMRRFFGSSGSGNLSFSQFSQFLKEFKNEMVRQEFDRYDHDRDGRISGQDFASILTSYVEKDRIPDYIKSNIDAFAKSNLSKQSVTFAEFLAFNNFLKNLDLFAETLRKKAFANDGNTISKREFVRFVREKTGVALSQMEADTIFSIFGDGSDNLSDKNYNDLVSIMRDRAQRNQTSWIAKAESIEDSDIKDVQQQMDTAVAPVETASVTPVSIVPASVVPQLPVPSATPMPGTESASIAFWAKAAIKLYEGARSFLMGSIAGMIGATVVYPIDVVKTLLQSTQGHLYSGAIDCFRKTYSERGFTGMYKGLGPQLVGVGPEKAIKLVVNDALRSALEDKENPGKLSLPMEIIAGGSAGGCQVIFTNPLEIVKIRLQMQSKSLAGGEPFVPKSAMQIVRELGPLGLYKGAGACLLRDVPFSAIYFPLYAHLKSLFINEKTGTIPSHYLLISGTMAGAVSAWSATPADVIKTRLQQAARKGDVVYTGLMDCARQVYAAEGYRVFFKGATMRVFRSAPQFGTTLLAYELLQGMFGTPKPVLVPVPGAPGETMVVNQPKATLVANVPVSEDEIAELRAFVRRRFLGTVHDIGIPKAVPEDKK
ncbi:mitochondrial solute carrier family 25 (mitochondrial aspartate/glutamate transporter) member 12/13 [Andalucia godoyi]|uniref:Mitochondrial solute carrier family 25 (Mitochondrial aspartate/glutamate transporter) member 12/13 n=1 Tax=Andalucia godoyi TaxID=505711 RepID=A0A8K0F0Y5_ANDGO|nr:mitochondrial solute carrier family 25 (mitochondrial aspartate/glutamate transporter) member 12/13 [Andalucia godoyi]|eukprot:ANDGO_04293.mRNA.1 mitochondrial solute carrier family 25 (mitochondrial aspartate/glutamate transporter) member 12/13